MTLLPLCGYAIGVAGNKLMMEVKQKLTLHQPATYQIKVPGHLSESWSDWPGGMAITVESEGDVPPVTTLTGVVADQAALQGLLRRLYSLGLPLISVNWVEDIKDGSEITHVLLPS